MLREIVLDTETTGTEAKGGDRLIEIGAVELLNHIPTGRTFHRYCNPQRPVSEGAFNVHGLSDAFLADKPLFAEIVGELLAFLADGRLVIHNAPFDVGFLNMEYARLGANAPPPIQLEDVVDTLPMARRKHPGAANNLDALCSRYSIDNTRRTKHGALLDAQILAEVYVELLGGKQTSLGLLEATTAAPVAGSAALASAAPAAPRPYRSRLTDAERARHDSFRASLGPAAIWAEYIGADDPA
ncbi:MULTISPECIES: DNA polymerase III subunit epsilon [unclassified Methylobacterium]|uniref:DNA polymerase III subunit epsilon n=1 Tax=unclassified Methylobacterium TaxID=2615210 RepID=UPI00036DC8AC|nr:MULTISPECIES: DNA polymerase III subunit epsilon [unclassified Methylobacterium]MBN4097785.1 DNA polymerase III subunit epsilon [Methylobacterium sp. OT2]SEG33452.1 DNA polymerase-3 subunit epsilon [Methylobacterium sp. 190mf]